MAPRGSVASRSRMRAACSSTASKRRALDMDAGTFLLVNAGTPGAQLNFAGPQFLQTPDGFVQLRGLSIRISPDLTSELEAKVASLEEVVVSLQQQLGAMAGQIATLMGNVEEDLAG